MCIQGEDDEIIEAEYRTCVYQVEQEDKLTTQVFKS